jgi:hypothetical protein
MKFDIGEFYEHLSRKYRFVEYRPTFYMKNKVRFIVAVDISELAGMAALYVHGDSGHAYVS